jgi:uncharacterized protein
VTITAPNRIRVLDSIRGIALCGILLMNIPWFGMPDQAVEDLRVRNELNGLNFYAWWIIQVFFQGTMRGLFSMLFGASAILVLEKALQKTDPRTSIEQYYRRLVVLLLFGFFNAYLLMWPGDILYTYAISGMFLFPFMRISSRNLLLAAGFFLIILSFSQSLKRCKPLKLETKARNAMAKAESGEISEKEKQALLQPWEEFQKNQSAESKREQDLAQSKKIKGNLSSAFVCLAEISYMLETSYFFNFFFLDALSFMLIGMALFRNGILSGQKSSGFYLTLMIPSYAIGIGLYAWQASAMVSAGFDPFQFASRLPLDFSEFGRLGLTLGNISLICLLYRIGFTGKILALFEPIGKMAFTNYLLQSIICGIIFLGAGLNYYNELERYQLYYVVGIVWLFHLILSHTWLRFYNQGPMEWLWRSATNGEWQPPILRR